MTKYILSPPTRALLVVIFFISINTVSKAQNFWNTLENFPPGPKTGIALLNDSSIVVGFTQGIVVSSNRGNTFDTTLYGPNVYHIFASSKGDAFAGSNGVIYKSVDNGKNWNSILLNSEYPVTEIVENNDGDLFAITGYLNQDLGYVGDGVFFSEDDGENWEKRNNGLGIYTSCENIAVDKNNRIYLSVPDEYVTGNGGLFVSDDKGLSWQHIDISVDGKGIFDDHIKIANCTGLSVSPEDSLYYSFSGTAVNVLVRLNTVKHIDDVSNNNYWVVYEVFDAVSWWLDWNLFDIHFSESKNWYSSTRGTTNSGFTYFTSEGSVNWERQDAGLGINIFGLRDRQFFAENSDGTVFMVQWLDEKIYYCEEISDNPELFDDFNRNQLTIYPNPVSRNQKLSFKFKQTKSINTVKIFDQAGRTVNSIILNDGNATLSAPAKPGLYFVVLEGSVVKLVVR